jgi:hypothetical protein
MRNTLVAVVLMAFATSLSWSAPWEGRRGQQEQPRGPQREQAGPGRGAPPDRRMERDERREGALSQEERRALHQDLDRANRELYRRR